MTNDVSGAEGDRECVHHEIDLIYGSFLKVIRGQGTICLPIASEGQVPEPNDDLMPPEEIQALWNKVVKESVNQNSLQQGRDGSMKQKEKIRKLELLLQAALKGGNLDLAMLLLSGLESMEVNRLAGGVMKRIQELQQQRKTIAEEMGKLGKEEGQKASSLNMQAGDVSTEIGLLQTFLQDLMAQKNEAQQLASNYLKSRHDTAQSIIRNMA
jgi:hypothetical protein